MDSICPTHVDNVVSMMKLRKITLNKDGSPRKAGSGRKRGSISLMQIELGKLLPHLRESSVITIGRKWYEENFEKFETREHQSIGLNN